MWTLFGLSKLARGLYLDQNFLGHVAFRATDLIQYQTWIVLRQGHRINKIHLNNRIFAAHMFK